MEKVRAHITLHAAWGSRSASLLQGLGHETHPGAPCVARPWRSQFAARMAAAMMAAPLVESLTSRQHIHPKGHKVQAHQAIPLVLVNLEKPRRHHWFLGRCVDCFAVLVVSERKHQLMSAKLSNRRLLTNNPQGQRLQSEATS